VEAAVKAAVSKTADAVAVDAVHAMDAAAAEEMTAMVEMAEQAKRAFSTKLSI